MKHVPRSPYKALFASLLLAGSGGGILTMCAESQSTLPEPPPVKTTSRTKFSINAFPYDMTSASLRKVAEISRQHGNLCTVQIDNGIPWQDALDGTSYSSAVMEEWQRLRNNRASSQGVYLAIAPLQDDRINWATDHDGKPAPDWVRKASGADSQVLQAYQNHVLRAVKYFNPTYLNIGVEAGDLAAKKPQNWPAFVALFEQTRRAVKAEYPHLKIGISWGLPLLMKSGTLNRCAEVIAASDYVGISFYPYMGDFYRKIGGSSIPKNAPAQWREPYKWLRNKVQKPIAICETAYSSQAVQAPEWGLSMNASSDQQALYIRDLASIAKRDGYLFVMYFLPVDYSALKRKLGIPLMAFWEHTGFFDENLRPKPAWAAYQQAWLGRQTPATPATSPPSKPNEPAPPQKTRSAGGSIPLSKRSELFESPDTVELRSPDGMKWSYQYQSSEWAWALKSIPVGRLRGTTQLQFEIKSSAPLTLFLQLEEQSGEALFRTIKTSQDWKTLSLPFSSFQADPAKKKNGRVDPDQIKSLMIADSSGAEQGAKGRRHVELKNLRVK